MAPVGSIGAMANNPDGEALLAARTAAEDVLKELNPRLYKDVECWYDKELYGGLYGHGGLERFPVGHLPAIRNLLRARAAVYRAQRTGAIAPEGEHVYDSEVGNEQMAQTVEACLEALGQGPELPPGRHWDDFSPKWL